MKLLIILGCGGHAKVLIDVLTRQGVKLHGIVDPHQIKGSTVLNLPVLGDDTVLTNYGVTTIQLVNGVGSLPYDAGIRKALYERFNEQAFQFKTVIDTQAIIGSDVNISQGVQVMAGAIIQAGTNVAENTIVNTGAIVEHDCRIGQHVHIAPKVVICGQVRIGNNVHIGAGATVIQGINIGDNCIVGAGCVVTHDIADHHIIYPARPFIRQMNKT